MNCGLRFGTSVPFGENRQSNNKSKINNLKKIKQPDLDLLKIAAERTIDLKYLDEAIFCIYLVTVRSITSKRAWPYLSKIFL